MLGQRAKKLPTVLEIKKSLPQIKGEYLNYMLYMFSL